MSVEIPTGYTPGPWKKWSRRPTLCILGADRDQGRPVVSWQGFDEASIPWAEHRANANLIAIAPEMADEVIKLRELVARADALSAAVQIMRVHPLGVLNEVHEAARDYNAARAAPKMGD